MSMSGRELMLEPRSPSPSSPSISPRVGPSPLSERAQRLVSLCNSVEKGTMNLTLQVGANAFMRISSLLIEMDNVCGCEQKGLLTVGSCPTSPTGTAKRLVGKHGFGFVVLTPVFKAFLDDCANARLVRRVGDSLLAFGHSSSPFHTQEVKKIEPLKITSLYDPDPYVDLIQSEQKTRCVNTISLVLLFPLSLYRPPYDPFPVA